MGPAHSRGDVGTLGFCPSPSFDGQAFRSLSNWLLRKAGVKLRPTHCSHNLATLPAAVPSGEWGDSSQPQSTLKWLLQLPRYVSNTKVPGTCVCKCHGL